MKTFRIGGVHPAKTSCQRLAAIRCWGFPRPGSVPLVGRLSAHLPVAIVKQGDKVKVGTEDSQAGSSCRQILHMMAHVQKQGGKACYMALLSHLKRLVYTAADMIFDESVRKPGKILYCGGFGIYGTRIEGMERETNREKRKKLILIEKSGNPILKRFWNWKSGFSGKKQKGKYVSYRMENYDGGFDAKKRKFRGIFARGL